MAIEYEKLSILDHWADGAEVSKGDVDITSLLASGREAMKVCSVELDRSFAIAFPLACSHQTVGINHDSTRMQVESTMAEVKSVVSYFRQLLSHLSNLQNVIAYVPS
jgi:hypothetical protein